MSTLRAASTRNEAVKEEMVKKPRMMCVTSLHASSHNRLTRSHDASSDEAAAQLSGWGSRTRKRASQRAQQTDVMHATCTLFNPCTVCKVSSRSFSFLASIAIHALDESP